jgi:opacity protein-like surface antigen
VQTRLGTVSFTTALVVLTLGFSAPARAQGFISPLVGYDFGGDSGCPEISGCEDKNLNVGVGLGTLGSFFGAELDISYARNFFGTGPDYESSVLTVMGNVLVSPPLGPVRPYGTAGLGLLKSHVDMTLGALVDPDNNHFGWNIGGGLMIFAGEHFGVRGDIRHFHAFQDLSLAGLPLGNTKLDFGRASAAVVFRF